MTNSVWAARGPSTIGLRKDVARPGTYTPISKTTLEARILKNNKTISIGKRADTDKTSRIRAR